MYALVFGCLQPSVPLLERVRRLEATQYEGSIPFARSIPLLDLLVHIHPSGDPQPSEGDLGLTRAISKAARVLQIQLLDHAIIGQLMNTQRGRSCTGTPWIC